MALPDFRYGHSRSSSAFSLWSVYFQQYVCYMHWLKGWWTKCGDRPRAPPPDEVARQLGQHSLDGVNLDEKLDPATGRYTEVRCHGSTVALVGYRQK
jgi:hypothetical protein